MNGSPRLDHVSLTVTDRERAAAFYARHFGMSDRVHHDAHLLIVGGRHGLLALSEGPSAAGSLPRSNHFGFRASGRDAVLAARARFAADGVVECEWQDDGSFTRVQVSDPDGYLVELYAVIDDPATA